MTVIPKRNALLPVMKKKSKYLDFKLYLKRKALRNQIHKKRRFGKLAGSTFFKKFELSRTLIKPVLYSVEDLRLIENTNECLTFFRELRNDKYISQNKGRKYIRISLYNVTKIDYGFISVLTAIIHELKFNNIFLNGELPYNKKCKDYIIESGFLNNMYDKNGNSYKLNKKSHLIFFEKGSGELSLKDNIRLSTSIKSVVEYLTGVKKQSLPIKTILLEICGNSIEYSNTPNRQWLLGINYDESKVIFTVTDIGVGILKTLHRKFGTILTEIFNKNNDEILFGAFCKKYGSSTKEINRNKGLPFVKETFDSKKILNLKVLSNNVILHFDNTSKCKTFELGSAWFKGTFYQWEMTKDCCNL